MRREMIPRFDLISPDDYRYYVKDLKPFFSEQSFIDYKSKVEAELANLLSRRHNISKASAREIVWASKKVMAERVYAIEETTKHDIIAQVTDIKNELDIKVNKIKKRHEKKPDPRIDKKLETIEEAKRAVHRAATSYDIVDTANAWRYRDAFNKVIIPDMVALEKEWINAIKEGKNTLQSGRTHLQHAEPITYGFTMAWYVSRFGKKILKIKEAVDSLTGKFSGAVGAYNASSLFFDDPEEFERDLLEKIGIKPVEISTQIVQPEPMADLVHCVISAFSILANWADDMRNLMRPEIAEVGQPRGDDISRSSTMPHKKNPVGLENVKSLWKTTMPYIISMYLDQISDHQRDLTNSASQRYTPPVFNRFDYAIRRSKRIAKNLKPHPKNMLRNLNMSADKIVAEPLHLLLSSYGFPDSHAYIGKLVDESYRTGTPMTEIALNDSALQSYFDKFTTRQMNMLKKPTEYIGLALEKPKKIADLWESRLKAAGL